MAELLLRQTDEDIRPYVVRRQNVKIYFIAGIGLSELKMSH